MAHRTSRCVLAFLTVLALCVVLAMAQQIKTVPMSRTSRASGQEMYVAYCASCHGREGKGNGPAAPALKNAPSDLTRLAKSHGGIFPAEKIDQEIRGDINSPAHGSKDMPVWGSLLSLAGSGPQETSQRIYNLRKYIESLQEK